ncbi:hypothetical protein Bbelb_200470 [Branchiostoma belcheri]|nr:hypothetical protein Bbelb_200470 [Branchiostoma belcheri]
MQASPVGDSLLVDGRFRVGLPAGFVFAFVSEGRQKSALGRCKCKADTTSFVGTNFDMIHLRTPVAVPSSARGQNTRITDAACHPRSLPNVRSRKFEAPRRTNSVRNFDLNDSLIDVIKSVCEDCDCSNTAF